MSPVDNSLPRLYKVRVDLASNLFHSSEGAFLFPVVPLRAGTELHFKILSPETDVQPFHVLVSQDELCFAFVSRMKSQNLSTGVLLTYPSWESGRSRRIQPDEPYISFRHKCGLYAFSVMNKTTLITSSHISERMHDFLTMM